MTDAAPEWVAERERGSLFLIKTMGLIARWGPALMTDPLIWLVSLYFTLFPSSASAAASRTYLAMVLGRKPNFPDRHRHVRMFAHVILDRVRLLHTGVAQFKVNSRHHELIEARHRQQRGGVLLSAHFGSFELLRAFERTLPGLDVRYLMFLNNAGNTAPILERINPEVASKVISLSDGNTAMLQIRENLEARRFVAFLGDRMPISNPQAEVEVSFFDRPVRLPISPYLSALLAGVPIILCFAPRVGRRTYEIEMFEIYDGSPVPREVRHEKCRELAQSYAGHLQYMCRRYPYNWFNFFDFWSKE